MTWETKKALRARIADTDKRRKEAERVLYGLGYEPVPSAYQAWRRSEGQIQDDREARKASQAESAERANKARTEATQQALALVIQALELKQYRGHGGDLFDTGVQRFEADLQTTLRVRAERKRAEADAATEAKVAGLTKPAPKPDVSTFATGGFLNSTFVTTDKVADLADRVAKIDARLDATETAKKVKK